jgi:hypothetical protein
MGDAGDMPPERTFKWGFKTASPGSKMCQPSDGTEVDLYIKIVRATGLPAADSNGLSDPVCTLTVGKHIKAKYKTKIVNNSLDPVWNEMCQFNIMPQSQQIILQVHDDDGGIGALRLRSELLGEITIQLDCNPENVKLQFGKVIHKKLDLMRKKANTGQLEVKFMVVPRKATSAWDPFLAKTDKDTLQESCDWWVFRDESTGATIPHIVKKIASIQTEIDLGKKSQKDVAEADPLDLLPDEFLDRDLIIKALKEEKHREKEAAEAAATARKAAELEAAENARQAELDIGRKAREQEMELFRLAKGEEGGIDADIDAMEDGAAKKKAMKDRFLADVKRNTKGHEHKKDSKKSQKMEELKRKKAERQAEQEAWAADPEAHACSTRLASIYRGKQSRKATIAKKAAGLLPGQGRKKPEKKKTKKKAVKVKKEKKPKVPQYDAFTFEDPTNTLPEEIILKIAPAGMIILDKRTKGDLMKWKWSSVKDLYVDAPVGSGSEAEQADLVHLTVKGAKYYFEADDGQVIVDACMAAKGAAKEKKGKKIKPLPDGWTAHDDPASGCTYYYEAATETTVWDHPGKKTKPGKSQASAAGPSCLTCESIDGLEEDGENPGTFYCATCWAQY